jgi:hypothetical protein
MARRRTLAFAALALSVLPLAAQSAELPSRAKKAKPPESAEAAKKCNVGGVTGIVAANGVCVHMGGYVSAGFGGGQIK